VPVGLVSKEDHESKNQSQECSRDPAASRIFHPRMKVNSLCGPPRATVWPRKFIINSVLRSRLGCSPQHRAPRSAQAVASR
jgi:hypothetical protein